LNYFFEWDGEIPRGQSETTLKVTRKFHGQKLQPNNWHPETFTPWQWTAQRTARSKRAQIVGMSGAHGIQTSAPQKRQKIGIGFLETAPPLPD
jgi:hypothetical protein